MNDQTAVLIGQLVGYAIGLIVTILYLNAIRLTLKEIKEKNRTIEPGYVWISIIPFVGFVYQFFMYPKISESLYEEYNDRGFSTEGDFGKNIGLAICVCNILLFVPFISLVASIGTFILIIIYWTKTVKYKRSLQTNSSSLNGVLSDADLID